MERGFLAAAAEGHQSRESAADFERCLQLGGTDLRDDELVATLFALAGYYVVRADLRGWPRCSSCCARASSTAGGGSGR